MLLPAATPRQRLWRRVLPPQLFYALRFEVAMVPVRARAGRNRRAFRGRRELAVNVGAGTTGRPGWVNVDAFDAPGITCRHDCRWSLPFEDGAVRLLFAEHVLEHFEQTVEVPRFLAEVHRVLAPGGLVRLIVPDVERYLRAYCDRDWEALARIRPLHGRRDRWFDVEFETPLEVAQYVLRQQPAEPHQYGYDGETLELVLRRAGFRTVERRAFGESASAELLLDLPERASESLYVEARRD